MVAKKYIFIICLFSIIYNPTFLTSNTANSSQVEKQIVISGQFLNFLSAGNYPEAIGFFDASLFETMPHERLQGYWNDLTDQIGQMKQQIGLKSMKRDGYYVVVVTCEFEKRIVDIKVVFNAFRKITGFWFVASEFKSAQEQTYQAPEYVDEEKFEDLITFLGDEPNSPGATLSLPTQGGPFPAVVIIHDRDLMDRDGSMGGAKPYRDLAWGLACRGIAVLRYDKQNDLRHAQPYTVQQEVIDDVLRAVSFLHQSDQIQSDAVYILGHGFGGMLAPKIEQQISGIAGSILLGGHVAALEEVYLREQLYLFSLDGQVTDAENKQIKELRKEVARINNPRLEQQKPTPTLPLGLPLAYWLDIRQYHPGTTAQSLHRPMLILQGGKDHKTTLEDFRNWKKYLAQRKNVTYKLFLKLNHLFMDSRQPEMSSPEKDVPAAHVDQHVIASIADWIVEAK